MVKLGICIFAYNRPSHLRRVLISLENYKKIRKNIFVFLDGPKNNKDKIQLCGILFLITTFIPLIPSGSFFTTYGAVLFWLNYALMLPKKNIVR